LVTPPKSLSTMKAVTTSCFSPIWSTFCNNQCNKLVTTTKQNTKFILILYFLLIHSTEWLLHTKILSHTPSYTPSHTPRHSQHPLLDTTHYCKVFIRKWSAVCTKQLMKCKNKFSIQSCTRTLKQCCCTISIFIYIWQFYQHFT
jgi:hypothetical protein